MSFRRKAIQTSVVPFSKNHSSCCSGISSGAVASRHHCIWVGRLLKGPIMPPSGVVRPNEFGGVWSPGGRWRLRLSPRRVATFPV